MGKERKQSGMMVQTVGRKARSKVFGVIYSRTAVIIALLVLEMGLFFYLVNGASQHTNYLYGISVILSAGCVVYIINEEGNPSFKLTWLLFVIVLPVAGVAFYIYTKLELRRKIIGNRLKDLKNETESYMRQNDNVVRTMRSSRLANVNLSYFLYKQDILKS